MSDLINKYKEVHERMIDLLLEYYPLHESFLQRQSPQRTLDLRKTLKNLRLTIKELEEVAQLRMKERSKEWMATNRLPKDKKE